MGMMTSSATDQPADLTFKFDELAAQVSNAPTGRDLGCLMSRDIPQVGLLQRVRIASWEATSEFLEALNAAIKKVHRSI
jgi:hypothetical protein